MLAILLPFKSKSCVDIANRDKILDVRKNKALRSAIQKLIDKYGYATIYGYCSKINKKDYHLIESITDKGITEYEVDYYIGSGDYLDYCFEGKVMFKFRCYKVEEIKSKYVGFADYSTSDLNMAGIEMLSCLKHEELFEYLKYDNGYALHISNLKVFDKPIELEEFESNKEYTNCLKCPYFIRCEKMDNIEVRNGVCYMSVPLTKAPQNFTYIEEY